MNDATALASELLRKLAELDKRVASYRRDLTDEFANFSSSLLIAVPDNVSVEVLKSVGESMPQYANLFPDSSAADVAAERLRASTQQHHHHHSPAQARHHHFSPPPLNGPEPHDTTPPEHEREREFQGLFTPSYLPLLGPTSAVPHQGYPFGPRHVKSQSHDETTQVRETDLASSPSSGLKPAHTMRRSVSETGSVNSDGAGSTSGRRSALRRLSSSSATRSPRRVRFDFWGEEVLPTSSPQSNDDASAGKQATMRLMQATSDSGTAGGDAAADNDDDDDDEQGSGTALGTDYAEMPALTRFPGPTASDDPVEVENEHELILGEPLEDMHKNHVFNNGMDGDEDDDDDYLSLSLTKSRGAGSTRALHAGNRVGTKLDPDEFFSLTSISGGNENSEEFEDLGFTGGADDHDEDGVFLLDEEAKGFARDQAAEGESDKEDANDRPASGTRGAVGRGASKPGEPKLSTHQEEAGDDDNGEAASKRANGVNIPQPAAPSAAATELGMVDQPEPSRAAHPAQPQSSKFSLGMVGSYKGRPLTMGVVKNPELLAQMASLGEFKSFVGSTDGRTGLDDADISSFRASLGRVGGGGDGGVPCSMSERLAMEEALGGASGR